MTRRITRKKPSKDNENGDPNHRRRIKSNFKASEYYAIKIYRRLIMKMIIGRKRKSR